MEINKNKYNNIKYESDDTLNYSLSSISLHFNRDNFEKDKNLEIYIKDKDKLLKEYTFLKKIGQGTFGVVILAIHKITNEKVAIKILDKEKITQKTDIARVKKEIDILKKLRHKNIVHLFNVIDTLTNIFLIMEYTNGIELFDYITKNKCIKESEACYFYQQIISGIEYLGKLNITHRDIKPENLLVSNDKMIKIVDFGLSNTYKNNELLKTACGSPFYAAPEMIKGEKYNGDKVDIWSSGIVLYAMICGYLPFEDNDNQKLYQKIIEGKLEFPPFLSDEAKDIISHILDVKPDRRYQIRDIKNHSWFNMVNPKLTMTEGLLLNKYIIPFDENVILYISKKFNLDIVEIKLNILFNKHNQLTTTYYLLINKKIKNKEETIGDMSSDIFNEYIHNKQNRLSYYDLDINQIINERIKKGKKIENKNKNKTINMDSIIAHGSFNRYIINHHNSYNQSIPKYRKIINSCENVNKNKKRLKLEKNNENDKNELKFTKININNIIIPKNFLTYSYIKNNINLNEKEKINNNSNISKEYRNNDYYEIDNIKNDLREKKIESININLKSERYKSIQNTPFSNKDKPFLNIKNNNNIFLDNEKENNLLINPIKNINKLLYNKKNTFEEIYNYNTTRNNLISTPELKEKFFYNKFGKKTRKEMLTSYKKKKVLSFSFQKSKNILNNNNNLVDSLTNNINIVKMNDNMNVRKKSNIGNDSFNCIKLMDVSEGNNFYSNNFHPKSKLFTYKKIKISGISKKFNVSGRTESNDSKKINISLNPSFNTYENTSTIQINNFISNDKKNNCFYSKLSHKTTNNDENEMIFENPVINHIYDRKYIGKKVKNCNEKINIENKSNNKEKEIILNKIKINKNIDFKNKDIRSNKLVASNNLNNISNYKVNNSSICNYSNIYSNKNKSLINHSKNNNDLVNKSLNTNLYLFKKPRISFCENESNNFYIEQKAKEKGTEIKNKKKDYLRDSITRKSNLLNKISIRNFGIENKDYTPFDLYSLAFNTKENEIKDTLIKELNIKRIKFNEKKNKICCFKKDLRFELNVEKINENIYAIKFFKKLEERTFNNIYKDLCMNILNVFNKKCFCK